MGLMKNSYKTLVGRPEGNTVWEPSQALLRVGRPTV
jgi:hypothetical protein